MVTDFLKEYFADVMDYGFTAKIEEEFDEIANGKKEWTKTIDGFYKPFKIDVDNTLENAERAKGERELGLGCSIRKKSFCAHGSLWANGTNW